MKTLSEIFDSSKVAYTRDWNNIDKEILFVIVKEWLEQKRQMITPITNASFLLDKLLEELK